MKASDVVTVAVVALGAYGAYRAIRAGQDAVAGIGDALTSAYDMVSDTVTSAAEAVAAFPGQLVDGTSIISDGNGFLKTDPQWDSFKPDWSRNRDIKPLIDYFRAYGNSAGTRASATAAGWTQQEISQAVSVIFWESQEQ